MTVSTILKSKGGDVVSVNPDDTLAKVVEILAKHRIGAVLIMSGQEVAGVLSERDVVRALAKHGAGALEVLASSVMTANVVSARPGDTIEHVMEKMTQGRFRHLPIVHEGKLVGIISIGDVVKRRIDDAEHEARALKEYVAGAGT